MANSFGDFNGDGHSNYVDYKIFTTQVYPGSGEYQGVSSSNRNYRGSSVNSIGTLINDLPYTPFVAAFLAIIAAIAIFFNLDSLFAYSFIFQFIVLMIVLVGSSLSEKEIDDKIKTNQKALIRNNKIKTVALTISAILFFIVAVIYREEMFGGKNFLKCISLLISIDSCIALLFCVSERKTILKAILNSNIEVQIVKNENIDLTPSSENSSTRANDDIWICKKCGRRNFNYVTSCTCGQSRLDN